MLYGQFPNTIKWKEKELYKFAVLDKLEFYILEKRVEISHPFNYFRFYKKLMQRI